MLTVLTHFAIPPMDVISRKIVVDRVSELRRRKVRRGSVVDVAEGRARQVSTPMRDQRLQYPIRRHVLPRRDDDSDANGVGLFVEPDPIKLAMRIDAFDNA